MNLGEYGALGTGIELTDTNETRPRGKGPNNGIVLAMNQSS